MSLLNETVIRQHLQNQTIDITILETTTSTNDYFKDKAVESRLHVCLAEHQTAGRGRFQRHWVAPLGTNILMSCRTKLQTDLKKLGTLSLCVGLAVIKALEDLGLDDLRCKWPNDLLYHKQKLAGILIETEGSTATATDVIIGIGLNVNMPTEILANVDRPTTSLQVILGETQDRNLIVALILNTLQAYLQRFLRQGFVDFQEEWMAHDALAGQEISLNVHQGQIVGIAMGVDANGQLLLQLSSGTVNAYAAGEASLHHQA